MSKKIFTDKQIKQLSNNPYVRSVSSKAITYTDAFKQLFISENNKGKPPRDIFEECDFDVTAIELQRVESSGKRWRASLRSIKSTVWSTIYVKYSEFLEVDITGIGLPKQSKKESKRNSKMSN